MAALQKGTGTRANGDAAAVRPAKEIGGVLRERLGGQLNRCARELHEVAQRRGLRERGARTHARGGELGVAVLDHDVVDAELVVAVGQTSSHDRVGDAQDLVPALDLDVEANRARHEVTAVADGLRVDVALERHAKDGGLVLVEEAHRVAHVHGGLCPGVHARPGEVVAGAAVADGRGDAQGLKLRDELGHAGDLGGKRGVEDVPASRLLVLAEEVDRGLVHEQVLGHGTLVLAREARALQVDAEKRGAVVGTALDDLTRLLDAPERLLRRVREDGAEPAGCALGGKEAPDSAQALDVGCVHVKAGGAVSVHVDEARQGEKPARVDDRQVLLVVIGRGEAGDDAVLDGDVQTRELALGEDARARDVAAGQHGRPP